MNTLLKSEEVLALLNAHYSLDKIQSCHLIRRGFNDHYLVELENARYVFRAYLNHKYYIESFDAFQFELDLLEHLHHDGVPVANAMRRSNGELLGSVSTQAGDRTFALFPYAAGSEIKSDTLTIEQCFQLGSTMAKLHLSANHFHSKHKGYHLDLKYLLDEPLKLFHKLINEKQPSFLNEKEKQMLTNRIESLGSIEDLVKVVNKIPLNQDEFGIIHADLHTGNVHFEGNELMVFDFDHCAYGWRAYDLAICLYLSSEQCEAMLRGYESLRPLSVEERECLPIFFKLRGLWNIADTLATESIREAPPQTDN